MDASHSAKANQKPCTKRKKVKTGCRTCKTRRVKCGEERPSCLRCVNTGRICDGYGIWGGGGRSKPQEAVPETASPNNTLSRDLSRPLSFGSLTPREESCFRWFRYRTFIKLPLPYVSPFWHSLVFQACAVEPAVFHAVIALSAAHRKDTFSDDLDVSSADAEFMLLQYGKAIHHLQPHFSAKDNRSLRVALATCALFTFFEYLVGNYDAAHSHLLSGLKLLAAGPKPTNFLTDKPVADGSRGYVDDWIGDTFLKLYVQAALFKQIPATLYPGLSVSTTDIPSSFQFVDEANEHMDRILLRVMHLEEQCSFSSTARLGEGPVPIPAAQEPIQKELDSWRDAWHSTETGFSEGIHPFSAFRYQLLYAYHTMATIMLHACNWPGQEMFYDDETDNFLLIMRLLIGLWKTHHEDSGVWHHERMTEIPDKITDATVDKGWVPILYFVGTKCRIRRLREHAMRMCGPDGAGEGHKEGTWDSGSAKVIIREVMRIEEGDFYEGMDGHDDFATGSIPTAEDVVLPPLPEEARLRNLQVRLPPDPTGFLTLEFDQVIGNDGTVERKARYYDTMTKTWADVVYSIPELDLNTLHIEV